MQHRLVRIRENERPAALLKDLDPVEQVDIPLRIAFVQHPHHGALQRPRARQLAVDQRRARQLGDELGQRPVDTGEQPEQLAHEAIESYAGRNSGKT